MVNEETIGFHKGALSTLSKEREELVRMIGIVEQLMQMHIKELKDLGVDLMAQAKEIKNSKNVEKRDFMQILKGESLISNKGSLYFSTLKGEKNG